MSDIPYELLMKIQHGTMNTRYRGLPMLKNPFDLALYTMLLERVQPATLIEIGTNAGGSALWFADQRSGMRVLSIDLEPPESVSHPSVRFLRGDARRLGDVLTPDVMQSLARPLLVVEDSSHFAGTTAAVLDFFDARLRELTQTTDGVAFMNDRDWYTAHWAERDSAGDSQLSGYSLGGRTEVANTRGDAPNHLALGDGHAGTVANGLFAQELIRAVDRAFGWDVPTLTDAEIAAIADPDGRYGIAPVQP